MKPDELHHLLSLLAAVIFADRRILDVEEQCFIETVLNLPTVLTLDPTLDSRKLSKWYAAHKDTIRQQIYGPYAKDWLYNTLDGLSGISNKRPLLNAMMRISKSDDRVHVKERSLMVLAAEYWGL